MVSASPTEVADGASRDTWNPRTTLVAISKMIVIHGRPIGRRSSSSTTTRSTTVWSAWTTPSALRVRGVSSTRCRSVRADFGTRTNSARRRTTVPRATDFTPRVFARRATSSIAREIGMGSRLFLHVSIAAETISSRFGSSRRLPLVGPRRRGISVSNVGFSRYRAIHRPSVRSVHPASRATGSMPRRIAALTQRSRAFAASHLALGISTRSTAGAAPRALDLRDVCRERFERDASLRLAGALRAMCATMRPQILDSN